MLRSRFGIECDKLVTDFGFEQFGGTAVNRHFGRIAERRCIGKPESAAQRPLATGQRCCAIAVSDDFASFSSPW